jgi:hypothetical protein
MILRRLKRTVGVGLAVLVLMGCAAIAASTVETPGERFRGIMEEMTRLCVEKKLKPTDSRCNLPKLKPTDPLAKPEGRFAHSIKIPNPVPADSGYKPGMTPQEYFDHLCKTEAGEFIYKTVENVEGLYQIRSRQKVGYEANHLYALEDPYRGPEGSNELGYFFVEPGRYRFLEARDQTEAINKPDEGNKVVRYFGYDGKKLETMQKELGARNSRYGYTWRGIKRLHDRELGIGGSELIVLDLKTDEVLAVHRGYVRFEIDERFGTSGLHWTKRCPAAEANRGGGARLQFLLKVLKPAPRS